MKTFGVGIIGCGWIFTQHAYALHIKENIEVKAVCDIKPDTLKTASKLFHCDEYSDYKEMLKREDIDAIHVLTPHYLHASMVIDAANAGKHVLTEKPMCIKIEDAKAMIEAGKRNNVTIGVISQNRYNGPSLAVRKAIDNGSLGKAISQRILLTFAKPESYYQNSGWRGTWDKEGGALLIDQSIHQLDLGRWFIDDEIISVDATLTNRMHAVIKTEDTAEGLIKYRNGARSVFYATNNLSYDAAPIIETHFENGMALLGFDRAVITYVDGHETIAAENPFEGYDESEFQTFFNMTPFEMAMSTLKGWGVIGSPIIWKNTKSVWGLSHIKQINNFYDSIATGKQPDINAEEAFKTQEMMCAIYESAQTHSTIKLH